MYWASGIGHHLFILVGRGTLLYSIKMPTLILLLHCVTSMQYNIILIFNSIVRGPLLLTSLLFIFMFRPRLLVLDTQHQFLLFIIFNLTFFNLFPTINFFTNNSCFSMAGILSITLFFCRITFMPIISKSMDKI